MNSEPYTHSLSQVQVNIDLTSHISPDVDHFTQIGRNHWRSAKPSVILVTDTIVVLAYVRTNTVQGNEGVSSRYNNRTELRVTDRRLVFKLQTSNRS